MGLLRLRLHGAAGRETQDEGRTFFRKATFSTNSGLGNSKSQAPKSRETPNFNSQITRVSVWVLVIGTSLVLGYWDLEIRAPPSFLPWLLLSLGFGCLELIAACSEERIIIS